MSGHLLGGDEDAIQRSRRHVELAPQRHIGQLRFDILPAAGNVRILRPLHDKKEQRDVPGTEKRPVGAGQISSVLEEAG